jgi:transposase-like protein
MKTIECQKHGNQPTYKLGYYKKNREGIKVFRPQFKCKACHKEYVNRSYHNNPEPQKQASKKWRAKQEQQALNNP